jgi:hypothetical protein
MAPSFGGAALRDLLRASAGGGAGARAVSSAGGSAVGAATRGPLHAAGARARKLRAKLIAFARRG